MESRHCFLAHSRQDNFNFKLVAVSTAYVMQCAIGSCVDLRWSALLFMIASCLVPSLVHFRKLVVAIKLILQIQQLSQNSSSNIQLSTLEGGNFAKTAHFSICCCQRMLAGL